MQNPLGSRMMTKNNFSERRGKLFVLSAPSGGGKTTLYNAVKKKFPNLRYSISYTTRKPRGDERHGVDYFFITEEEFKDKIRDNEWLEWALVHGNYYGTSKTRIEGFLRQGEDILLDIDVQGTRQIVQSYPDSTTIFIMPPSLAVLKTRLVNRGLDDPKTIETRLKNAKHEIAQKDFYQYVIINDDISKAVRQLISIIESHRKSVSANTVVS